MNVKELSDKQLQQELKELRRRVSVKTTKTPKVCKKKTLKLDNMTTKEMYKFIDSLKKQQEDEDDEYEYYREGGESIMKEQESHDK